MPEMTLSSGLIDFVEMIPPQEQDARKKLYETRKNLMKL
jgi:hypothetical protein